MRIELPSELIMPAKSKHRYPQGSRICYCRPEKIGLIFMLAGQQTWQNFLIHIHPKAENRLLSFTRTSRDVGRLQHFE